MASVNSRDLCRVVIRSGLKELC